MRIIYYYGFKLLWGIGLVVLIGLLITPDMGMAREVVFLGAEVVQGDPGDGLGLPSFPNQNEKRDSLELPKKIYCGDPEDGLGFFPGDPEDGLDWWDFKERLVETLLKQYVTVVFGSYWLPCQVPNY